MRRIARLQQKPKEVCLLVSPFAAFSTNRLLQDSNTLDQNQTNNSYSTGIPAVNEFWSTCIKTPHVLGPNVALSKVRLVSEQLNAADEAQSTPSPTDSNESGANVAPARLFMTKQDAILHASVSSRISSFQSSNSSSSTPSTTTTSSLPLPEFIYRRKTKEIQAEAEKIFHAYQEYYNHIKFRNGWEKPAFAKDDPLVIEMLREASDICARIRSRLDEENPTTKLRQADGSAQLFFNSPEAPKLFTAAKAEADSNDGGNRPASQQQRREFVKNTVMNTFKDAMGFVEGLTKTKVEKYFNDISDFGFNPSAHVQHLLLEMLTAAEAARLSFDVVDAVKYSHPSFGIVSQEASSTAPNNQPSTNSSSPPTISRRAHDKARLSRDNAHFCEEDGAEDKAWRDAISKLYKAHDALLVAMNERKKNAIKSADVSLTKKLDENLP